MAGDAARRYPRNPGSTIERLRYRLYRFRSYSTLYHNRQLRAVDAAEAEGEEVKAIREAIESEPRANRKYEDIEVGDLVKVIRKPGKYSEYKTNFNAWGTEVYKVEKIVVGVNGLLLYKLERRARPLLRHELLRVGDVQRPPQMRVTGKSSTSKLLRSTPTSAATKEAVQSADDEAATAGEELIKRYRALRKMREEEYANLVHSQERLPSPTKRFRANRKMSRREYEELSKPSANWLRNLGRPVVFPGVSADEHMANLTRVHEARRQAVREGRFAKT